MIKFKTYFLFIYFQIYISCREQYCRICPNHTLCKYKNPGPSPSCIGYDETAKLKEENINDIIERINERRNYVALGHMKLLPGAANMKKITWSQELATIAQRWVDQCEQTLRTDKEDECRNLESINVGQNIATITGHTSSFNVKSFIEIWYMQSLDFNGSVTYYNKSRDYRSNYFSQLIWANTEKVGCGKAKFFVKSFKTTLAERLVCNFAPRGNIHGKPVYIIGFAATQCEDDMQPDNVYSGLCTYSEKEGLSTSSTPLATSLLRIRNLFNDSVKQEIDPIYHNTDLILNEPRGCSQSHKTQDYNFIADAIKRSPVNNGNFWITQRINISRNNDANLYWPEKGHSRVYNNHNHRNEFDLIHPEAFFKEPRKHNQATTMFDYDKEHEYRKYNMKKQCTRNTESNINQATTECVLCNNNNQKCSRGQIITTPRECLLHESQTTTISYKNELCSCKKYETPCPIANQCVQNANCDCVSLCPFKHCPKMLRTLETFNENVKRPDDFHNYDFFSDLTSRKQNHDFNIPLLQDEKRNAAEGIKYVNNFNYDGRKKTTLSDYSDIKRSVTEDDINFKPFWQMDDYINKKQLQPKSMRYTTLRSRKNKISKRTKNIPKAEVKTEHITMKINSKQKPDIHRITEKYLSFEELMHLRKYSTGNFSGRRFKEEASKQKEEKLILRDSNKSVTTERSTTEYTANTPFVRMKYCTRKLTCTWTAATLTDSAGSIIPGGAGGAAGHMGSRTPPGYVEGCTRTSTCTRDYMNRNKMATVTFETTTPEFNKGDDDDYCERRSLNRRQSNNSIPIKLNRYNKTHLNNYLHESTYYTVNEKNNDCMCNNSNMRNKRNGMIKYNRQQNVFSYKNLERENKEYQTNNGNNIFSYSELYYYILRKITATSRNKSFSHSSNKCLCNYGDKIICNNLLLFLLMVPY